MDRNELIPCLSELYRQKNEQMLRSGLFKVNDEPYLPLIHSIRNRNENSGSIFASDIQIGPSVHQFTNREDLPSIADFTTEELIELPVALLIILQGALSEDPRAYWNHTYSVFNEEIDSGASDNPISYNIWSDLRYLFHLALSDKELTDKSHSAYVLKNTRRIAAYVSYPMLEGLLKDILDGVDQDGRVLVSETIERIGNDRGCYDENDECNNLTDLLCHYEFECAPPEVSSMLSHFRENLSEYDKKRGQDEAYGIITDWRGSAMHGEAVSDIQYGIILSLICAILWGTKVD